MDISGAVILPTMHTLGLYFKELFNVFAYVNGKEIGWNTSQIMTQNISYWYYPRKKQTNKQLVMLSSDYSWGDTFWTMRLKWHMRIKKIHISLITRKNKWKLQFNTSLPTSRENRKYTFLWPSNSSWGISSSITGGPTVRSPVRTPHFHSQAPDFNPWLEN